MLFAEVGLVSILIIILVVVLVLALLGYLR
jgi:hypothetical protein